MQGKKLQWERAARKVSRMLLLFSNKAHFWCLQYINSVKQCLIWLQHYKFTCTKETKQDKTKQKKVWVSLSSPTKHISSDGWNKQNWGFHKFLCQTDMKGKVSILIVPVKVFKTLGIVPLVQIITYINSQYFL